MIKKIFVYLCILLSVFNTFSLDLEQFQNEQYILDSLLEKIDRPREPIVHGDYIIFTASPKTRHTGIAFDFEQYKIIHSYKNLVRKNEDADNTKSHVSFYILKIPQNLQEMSYRLVMDGLWTTDPLNTAIVYDKNVDLLVSHIKCERPIVTQTKTKNNAAHFIYEGESGQRIRLAGNFTNWDPFIYELKETSKGVYELELPLPKGTYYYTYYSGINSFLDNGNPEKAYTNDGRVASVITLN